MAPPVQNALSKIPLAGRFGIGIGISAVLMFGYWFVFYSEVASKIEGAERQKKDLAAQFIEQQQAQATYFSDRGELALREQHARDLNKVLPPEAQEDAFLSTIQTASNAAGIELRGYAPLEETPEAFYSKVPMGLDVSGKFHQIAKFVFELGKVDRIINVENIALGDPTASGDEIVLRGHCLVTAFHALLPKESPRGEAGGAEGPK
jgi:type IV pilus assembly protein PilO